MNGLNGLDILVLLAVVVAAVGLIRFHSHRGRNRRRATYYTIWHDPTVWEAGKDVRKLLAKPSVQTQSYEDWLSQQSIGGAVTCTPTPNVTVPVPVLYDEAWWDSDPGDEQEWKEKH